MDYKEFEVIPGYENWENIKVVNKGWSGDKKYTITTSSGEKQLLRISNISLYESRKKQFELLQQVEKLNVNASRPISFGKLNDNEIYMVLSWLEGEDAEIAVARLSDEEAYKLGVEAGEILNKLHKLMVDKSEEMSWGEKFTNKMKRKYKALEESKVEVPKKEIIIDYMNKNMHLTENREQTFTHGDYHLGNLIVNNGRIGVIDFDKNKISDPYDDFKSFVWNALISEYFATGMINGYFDNNIPEDFFPLLAVYATEQLISYLPWAATLKEEDLEKGYYVHNRILEWYDDMNLVVPKWYKKDVNFQWNK